MVIDISRIRSHVQGVMIEKKHFRRGQALWHGLWELYPTIANDIRGTNVDPTHDDSREYVFWEHIKMLAAKDTESNII
jgi:hypothetical protein